MPQFFCVNNFYEKLLEDDSAASLIKEDDSPAR